MLYDIKSKKSELDKAQSAFMEAVNKSIAAGDFDGAAQSKVQESIKSLTAEKNSLEKHLQEVRRMIANESATHETSIASQKAEVQKLKDQASIALKDAQNIKAETLKGQVELSAKVEAHNKREKDFEAKLERARMAVA